MKNFLRAVRFAWNYRVRLFVSVGCAVLAAIFWGLNFTAIYPVLKIIGSDRNLQQWVNGEIERINKDIDKLRPIDKELTDNQKQLESQPPSNERSHALRDNAANLANIESKLAPPNTNCGATRWPRNTSINCSPLTAFGHWPWSSAWW